MFALLLTLLSGCGRTETPARPPAVSAGEETSDQSDSMDFAEIARRLRQGRTEEAEDAIRSRLIEEPGNVQATLLLVRVYRETQREAQAIEALRQLRGSQPNRVDEIDAQIAELLVFIKQDEKAIELLKQLVQRRPKRAATRRELIRLCEERGFFAEANAQARELVKTEPLQLSELVSLAFPTRSRMTRDQIEALTSDQTASVSPLSVAATFLIEGDPRSAMEWLERDVVRSSGIPSLRAFRARVLASAQLDEPLAQALAGGPGEIKGYADYWIASGQLANRRRSDAAVESFAKAIELEPGSIEAHRGMVEALEIQDRSEAAQRFRDRVRLLERIRKAIQGTRSTAELRPSEFIEISEMLMAAGRPLESIAWQEFVIQRSNPSGLAKVAKYKRSVLEEDARGLNLDELLCGLGRPNIKVATDWIASLDQENTVSVTEAGHSIESGKFDVRFENVAADLGVQFQYKNAPYPVERNFRIFEAFGGGVCCLDYDRDGRSDLYFAQAGTDPPRNVSDDPNALYRGTEEGFRDVIEPSLSDNRGYSTGVTSGDWNQDGFPDLLICNLGRNRLLVNQGDGTFQEAKLTSLTTPSIFTSSAAIADVTGDGLPDIVEINYVDDDSAFDSIVKDSEGEFILPGPLHFKPAMDRVLVTHSDGTVSAKLLGQANDGDARAGLGLVVSDLDGDGANDICVANDLYANQWWNSDSKANNSSSDGIQWMDQAVGRGLAFGANGKPMACMGIAVADFDGNGRNDIHICNFEGEWSNQYMQSQSGQFVDAAVRHNLDRLSHSMLGFGVQAIDLGNDSHWDLVVGNGHVEDLTSKGKAFAMPTQVLLQRNGQFESLDDLGDDDYWNRNHFGRGMSKCDFNNDGRVDVVISDLKEPAVLLENQTQSPNYFLRLELVGTRSGRDAIGTEVKIDVGNATLLQTVQTGDGYMSRNEATLTFGTGSESTIKQLTVRWPSGETQRFENIATNQQIQLIESQTPWTQQKY